MGITRQQALECLGSDDLIGIGMEADAVRRTMHPEGVVTYALGVEEADGNDAAVTLVFGLGESVEDRLDRMEALRAKQAETGAVTAVRLVASAELAPEDPTAVEYLKMLAVARLYLDNIENVEASLGTQGLKVLQMALRFGANDAGVVPDAAEEDVRRVIRGAGFQPVERDTHYRVHFLV